MLCGMATSNLRLVRLELANAADGSGGKSVWLNPDQVISVAYPDAYSEGDHAVVTAPGFGVIVKGSPPDVVRTLRGDTN